MKKILLLMMFVLPGLLVMAKDSDSLPDYQMEAESSDNTGTASLVRVSVLNKNKNVSDETLEKCAVHGAIFRGYAENKVNYGGSSNFVRPLAGSPTAETEFGDFFKPFFANGDYKNYVSVVGSTRRVVKAGKEYKVSATVRINVSQLRKDLEKAGVIKGLGTGFR